MIASRPIIPANDEHRLRTICERYGVRWMAVFGSVARGDAGVDSDVDVLYDLRAGHSLGLDIEDLACDLAALFGRARVDLVRPKYVNPFFRDNVLRDARVIYES